MRVITRLILLLCLAAGLLTACSATRLAYNQSHWLVSWQLGGYLDLDWGQRRLLRDEVRALRAWHRETQLATYARDLHWLADRLEARAFDAETLRQSSERLEGHFEALLASALPHVVTVARAMDETQLEALEARLLSDMAERVTEAEDLPIEEWHEQVTESAVERMEEWVGEIEADQRARIARWARQREASPGMWRARSEQTVEQAFVLLDARHEPGFATRLQAFIVARSENRPADLQEAAAADRAAREHLLLDLEAGLRPRQRRHLVARLREYAQDAHRLAD